MRVRKQAIEPVQCDCCGKMFPAEDVAFIRHDHPNSNAHMDTTACPKCRGAEPDYEYEDRLDHFDRTTEGREP